MGPADADAPLAQGLPAAAERLWTELAPAWPGFSVELLPEIDSTNTELMRRARAGRNEPVLLVAQRQTAGRGRLGRAWASAPGDSLTFSIGVPLAPVSWSGLSLVVGVALADALDGLSGGPCAEPSAAAPVAPAAPTAQPRLALKWPNDLWLCGGDRRTDDGRKLAGILIETAVAALPPADATSAAAARQVIVGIGINLAAPPADGLSTPPAGLRERVPGAEAGAVLAQVVPPVMQALRAFERTGFAPWQARFAARDALHGRRVKLSDGREGEARGVNAQGELLVHTDRGMETVSTSEISVRPAGAPAATAPASKLSSAP